MPLLPEYQPPVEIVITKISGQLIALDENAATLLVDAFEYKLYKVETDGR